ncbi:TetR/AcrR family transcriptional regulator [Mycolicibacterium mengxianglii]|uniref:TetR/AcrR family transcriptional regulator n=1 Tax=Mycolicibacterium mengxianglii TaxID=2736649 RepID=UPI0018D100B0|nr:TetR/AcrR family transcriptional regulator [Mycolicibacterium mengxianglii]
MATRQRNARGEGSRLREDLLAGAQRILERTGSEDDVSLRAVAREVGVSAPSIYAHFPDGKAIVDALVQQTFEELSALLRQAWDDSPPTGRLHAVCLTYIRFGLDRPERYLTLFERRRSLERTAQLASAGHGLMYPNGAEAFGILVNAIDESGVDSDSPAEEDAALLWASLHGYVTLRSSTPGFRWFADEEHVCEALIRRATSSRPTP